MFERVNDPIEILVNFTYAGAIPLYFTWKGTDYEIKDINFIHTSKEGDSLLYHFAVSTKNEAFKLTFNTKHLLWRIKEVYSEGFVKDYKLNDVPNIKQKYKLKAKKYKK
ncbi:MAG: hypothetical protein ACOZAO_03280 [Patescibacteria group bacterium]